MVKCSLIDCRSRSTVVVTEEKGEELRWMLDNPYEEA